MQNDKLFIVLHRVVSWRILRGGEEGLGIKIISNKCTQIAQVNIKKSFHCFRDRILIFERLIFGLILAGHKDSINYV